MNTYILSIGLLSGALLTGCDDSHTHSSTPHHDEAAEYERGPHGGRLLTDGDIALELATFETGVAPEFRIWVTDSGAPVNPGNVEASVQLTRLGDHIDAIRFTPEDDFLRGDKTVYEPHSFAVTIEAQIAGKPYRWTYENFEGRTRIDAKIAAAFELGTEVAGPAVIEETIDVYGRIAPDAERARTIGARFAGVVEKVNVRIGESVVAGQTLATVESNDSLKSYSIKAPTAGVIVERNANPGEQTESRTLFTLMDPNSLWVQLSIFPADRTWVHPGASVFIEPTLGGPSALGTIDRIDVVAAANQSVQARVILKNPPDALLPGVSVRARLVVAEHAVPLAVRRTGLQSYRDFTVVYAQVGDEYEVRMLNLGRQAGEWAEVLAGLEPGTRYVTANSFLVKADIEKSGASHDH